MVHCTCSEAGVATAVKDQTQTRPSEQTLVEIEKVPPIGETPQSLLQNWVTPNPLFYVRNHFDTPEIEMSSWRLSVDGFVSEPGQLDFDDIKRLPKYTSAITLECAGNNRSDLEPPTPGNQFQSGAVSTAVWAGVALKDILEEAGIVPGARQVLFEGADSGTPVPGGPEMSYVRSLPMEVAMHPDTLVAYEMNGEELPIEHGYPLRLVVPGWYGMASVKWLSGIKVIDYEFEGFFQTDRYVIENDDGVREQIKEMSTKSLISSPSGGEVLANNPTCVAGMAWSGNAQIKNVEFSSDGGQTWEQATLTGPSERYAWQQWHMTWTPLASGHYTLACKATDRLGNVQPIETRWNAGGYVVNGVRPVCVTVAA
jgi:DMSO/TMAO reductase YedYZ molybdopterin-dependent catalytic subunit